MKRLVFLFLVGLVFNSFSAIPSGTDEQTILIREKGKPSLGVVITDPEKEELEKNKLSGGVLIKEVLGESQAEQIGLEKGDIIVEFDGSTVRRAADLKDKVAGIDSERTVNIEVVRAGEKMNFQAEMKPQEPKEVKMKIDGDEFDIDLDLEELKEIPHRITKGLHLPHHTKGGFLGVYTTELTEGLKNYFQVEYGLLIEEIVEHSPADSAGLKAGDVILKINDRQVNDRGDLVRFINYYDPGDKIIVTFSRKGDTKTMDVKLSAGKSSGRLMHLNLFDDDGEFDIKWEKKMKSLKDEMSKLKEMNIDIELYII